MDDEGGPDRGDRRGVRAGDDRLGQRLAASRHGRLSPSVWCLSTAARSGLPYSTSRLTTIEGSSLPSMPASTLRAVEIAMRTAASLLSPALCGVRITFSSAN